MCQQQQFYLGHEKNKLFGKNFPVDIDDVTFFMCIIFCEDLPSFYVGH